MKHRSYLAFSVVGLSVAAVIWLAGCGDEITITQAPENRPPQILLSGPEYAGAHPIESPLPQHWVLATDPDGAEDIAAVVLNISTVTLTNLIVRPDDPYEECRRPYYVDMDTLDVSPYLDTHTFKVTNLPLGRGSGGVYGIHLSYFVLSEGGIGEHGDVFGDWVKACRWGSDYRYMIEEFSLNPPALSPPRDVYVTYAEFEISGITITVYDQSGATASKEFPDFLGYFTKPLEKQTLP